MAEIIAAVGVVASILTLGQAACDAASTLCKFFKDVDATVQDLKAEMLSLKKAYDLVDRELKGIVGKAEDGAAGTMYDPEEYLYKFIHEQEQECRESLNNLNNLLEKLGPTGLRSFTKKVLQRSKLKGDEEELKRVLDCVRAHTASLRIILQLVNIKISHLAPCYAAEGLFTKIKKLFEEKSYLLSMQKLSSQNSLAVNQYVEGQAFAATSFYASNDLATASDAGDSAICDMNYAEDAQDPGSLALDCENSCDASPSESMPPEARQNESDPATDILSENGSLSSPYSRRTDLNSEDQIATALFQSAMEAGEHSYTDCVWSEAHGHFYDALQLLQKVPAKHRQVDIFRLRFQLAHCAFYVQEPGTAAKSLLACMLTPATTDAESIEKATASHLLSQTYVRLDKLELARLSCQNALAVRERLCTKDHSSYIESVELMAEINELVERNEAQRQTFIDLQAQPNPDAERTLAEDASSESPGPLPAFVTDAEECSDTGSLTPQIYINIPGVVEVSVAGDRHAQISPELSARIANSDSGDMQQSSGMISRGTPTWRHSKKSWQTCRTAFERARIPKTVSSEIQNRLRNSLFRSRDNIVVFLAPAIQRIEPASDRFLEPIVGFFLDPWTGRRSRRQHRQSSPISSVSVQDGHIPVMVDMHDEDYSFTPIEPVRPALWIVATFVDIMEPGSSGDRVKRLLSALIEAGSNVVERLIAEDAQAVAAEEVEAKSDKPTAMIRNEDDALIAVLRALLKEVPSLLRFVGSVIDASPSRYDQSDVSPWRRSDGYGPRYNRGHVEEIPEDD